MYYDLILVGSGFASSFFLERILKEVSPDYKILILELGEQRSHRWQVENNRQSNVDNSKYYTEESKVNKKWVFNLGFGGSSNCWSACTPRMMEADFCLKSKFGVGVDWPLGYQEMEPYYTYIEKFMSVSGPSDWTLSYRSEPFPLSAHRFSTIDEALKAAYPKHYYQQASARPTKPVDGRPACCSSAVCDLCPIDSKFSVLNSFKSLYSDERVTLKVGCEVDRVSIFNGKAEGVYYKYDGSEYFIEGQTVVLGANAIFNAAILIRSNYKHDVLGRYLHEQVSKSYYFDLDKLNGFDGSTLISGQGFMFYEGVDRSVAGACLLENFNTPVFRLGNPVDWRRRAVVKFIIEDLPLYENRIEVVEGVPKAIFERYSDYGLSGLNRIPEYIEELTPVLGIKEVHDLGINSTEAHIQGTVRMGENTDSSIVDSFQRVHDTPNLYVIGSSSFPTGAPVNPTLTLSALSIRSAEKYLEVVNG